MKNPEYAIILGALSLALASTAAAECQLGPLTAAGGVLTADYDGFAPSDTAIPIRLTTASHPDCAGSRVRLELTRPDGSKAGSGHGLELANGADRLIARLDDRAGRGAVRSSSSEGAVDTRLDGVGAIPPGETQLSLARGQRISPGLYQGQFRLVAEAFDDSGNSTSRSESSVAIAIRVQPSVGLSAAWGTELDLGTITANGRALEPLRFRAYSNTPYDITLRSDNRFGLIRSGRGAGLPIAYSPVLSGEVLSEGVERKRAFPTPPVDSGFRDHTLDVVVPVLDARPAGSYQDFITVTIHPVLG